MLNSRGAIAAGHPKTAEAGHEILQAGGNAFDAAIAAVLAACVCEPALTSLAGGGFLLAHTSSQNILFDFFTQTPKYKRDRQTLDFYATQVDFGGGVTQEFHIGLGSMAVPGTVAGLFHIHQRLGRLPLSAIAAPALHFAQMGVEVSEFQAYCFKILQPILTATEAGRQIYQPSGALLQAGDRITLPGFAATLDYLITAGAKEFYQGDMAQEFIKDCQAGGYLTLADLAEYRVIERQPLETCYRGNRFLTNPPPSSGGALIGYALGLMEELELTEFGTATHLQTLATVMRQTNQARTEATNKWGSTTHISVVDGEGNAASVTTSNGEGSSYIIPGTGIMVNNMLGEADLHPDGFHQWQEDVRISSMMAPTIVLQDGKPEIVLGSGGSNRIRTAILQVISNLVDFGMSVEEAVSCPRVHWEQGVFNLEPGFIGLTEIDRTQFPFNQQVELWQQQNMFFGGVHAVGYQDGRLAGMGDRRRGGAIAIVDEASPPQI